MQSIFTFLLLMMISVASYAQASLTVENNSIRQMTVKVINGVNWKGSLHKIVPISAYGNETLYFSESGSCFTKIKAVIRLKDTVCKKSQPFRATSDDRGYSVMTLTFLIKESNVPQVTGGKQISKQGFEIN